MSSKHVKINLRPLRRLKKMHRTPEFKAMSRKWGVRYLAFARERFVKYSKGGGNWKPLSPETIASRRSGKGSGSPAILRDTGTLLKGLTIGAPGNLFKFIKGGIRVGFGGSSKHPQGKMTIRRLAEIHNKTRPILVKPNLKTINGMMKDLRTAMFRIARRAR